MYHDMFHLGEFALDPVVDLLCDPVAFLDGDLAVDRYLHVDVDPVTE